MAETKRILIAGCGDVGGELGAMLAKDGHQVWGLRRSPERLSGNVLPLRGDLAANDFPENFPLELDLVFYTAAASDHSETGYRQIYVEGLDHLLNKLRQNESRPDRIFFTSSTSVYGQSDGSVVDENSPTSPERFSGRIMLEAEKTLLASEFPATIVRLAGIYGPGRTRLLKTVANGGPFKDLKRYANRIHRDDCACVLRHLAAMHNPESLYIGVDDEPVAYFDILVWLADQLKAQISMPDQTDAANFGKRCSNQKLRETGFSFRFPSFRDGYPGLIRTFR